MKMSIDELKAAWNAQADAMNRWDELGLDEIVDFAQEHLIARTAELDRRIELYETGEMQRTRELLGECRLTVATLDGELQRLRADSTETVALLLNVIRAMYVFRGGFDGISAEGKAIDDIVPHLLAAETAEEMRAAMQQEPER